MKIFGTLLMILLVSTVSSVQAGSTATLQVSATVTDSCNFQTSGSITFGNLDRSSGLNASVNNGSAASFRCTNGTPFTISDDGGLSGAYQLQDGSGNQIGYSLAYLASGVGDGSQTDLSVSGDILYTSYQAAPEGAYTDTVVLTINY